MPDDSALDAAPGHPPDPAVDPSVEPVAAIEPALDHPVIGIGASAGGLEAVTEMFRTAEAGTGMAFVLVQHLDPNHESMMAELLSRKTQLTVRQIEDGDSLAPDVLHVIPPGHSLSVEGGRLRLTDFSEPRGLRRPIDSFFASLARAQGQMAACVVLSGTGADGSTGMRAIKDVGGICVAQDPEEARYDGMPTAATGTGMVDFTLPAAKIAPKLADFFSRRLTPGALEQADDVADVIDELCVVLRDTVGHDFSGYKRSTMTRRIERRMHILDLATASDYLGHLRMNGEECEALFRDLLINVTSFFRDPSAFEELSSEVIEPLVQGASAAEELRVWVPGCSSGQEAYTIAMLIDDAIRERGRRPHVQVFATDIDDKMIEIGREGRYSASALSDIPERFRDEYTVGLDGQFQMAPRLREMVRFSVHSLIKDPPFSKIDLISCRNLLIYLGETVQRAVIPLMHFSLRPGGHLFLGPSENVTRRGDLFEPVSARARIFRRADGPARYPLDLPVGGRTRRVSGTRRYGALPRERDFPDGERTEDPRDVLFEAYAPPHVRIDADANVVGSSGDLSLYLKSQPTADRTLRGLARDGLRDAILPLVAEAKTSGRRAALQDVEAVSPFGTQRADVIAHPLPDGTVALVFLAKERFAAAVDAYAITPPSRDDRIASLEDELQTVRYRLKSTVEEVETANEELKSSNEEMMSMNEELQSANEELTTANEELKNKVDELAVANADLDAFLQSTDLAIVIVDRGLNIRHFTEAARDVFPLQPGDRSRPLGEIAHSIRLDGLPRLAMQVAQGGDPVEEVVRSEDGTHTYMLRILPYRGPDASGGATLTFSEITRLNALEEELRIETDRLALALRAAAMGVFDVDVSTNGITLDDRVAELFGLGDERHPTLDAVWSLIHPADRDETEAAFGRALNEGQPYEAEFRVVHPRTGAERWIRGMGQRVDRSDRTPKIFGLNYDVTAQHEAMAQREILLQEMSHRVKNLFAVLMSLIASTPKDGLTAEEFAAPLKSRVAALGKAYDLARTDALQDAVDFADLVRSVVRPHAPEDQLDLDGPSLSVPVETLTPLGLILHELATNAVKYGALSAAGGRVRIDWVREDTGKVRVRWHESAVAASEGTQTGDGGFGTRLIGFSVRQLGGSFERTFDGGDMTATFTFRSA